MWPVGRLKNDHTFGGEHSLHGAVVTIFKNFKEIKNFP